jgi:hypothetical protein
MSKNIEIIILLNTRYYIIKTNNIEQINFTYKIIIKNNNLVFYFNYK